MSIEAFQYRPLPSPYPIRDIMAINEARAALNEEFAIDNMGLDIITTPEGKLFVPDGAYFRTQLLPFVDDKKRGKMEQEMALFSDYIAFITNPSTSYRHMSIEARQFTEEAVTAAIGLTTQLEEASRKIGVQNDLEILLPPTVAILEPGMNMMRTHRMEGGTAFKSTAWYPPVESQIYARYKGETLPISIALFPPNYGDMQTKQRSYILRNRLIID